MMTLAFKALVVVLQVYFVFMNFVVEQRYCHAPLSPDQDGFLAVETYEFSSLNNRLFLARPEWMRQATCVSGYIFWIGYVTVIFATLTDSWRELAVPLLLFSGAKIYALMFYVSFVFSPAACWTSLGF